MLFSSQTFLIGFLPVVLVVYYLAAEHRAARTWLLIAASLAFYGYWDPRLLPLLAGSICANWLLARAFERQSKGSIVAFGVALNLVLLGIFKYFDFFADNLAALTGGSHDRWSIILPLGISFFTFQQISYLIDMRRGEARLYSFADYALYVSFFPQLIAGPIVRHGEIVFQYSASPLREGLYERLSRGLTLMTAGLVKKALLADNLALLADPLFAESGARSLTFAEGWMAAGAFGLQIYFDFSGYSDMAIGLGLLFGLGLPVNFNAPYRATSIRDFWRRWHITLSRFLRDYLYFPLGGSRFGFARQSCALVATMLLGGLWHGAGWTFVVWGGLHGIALAINRAWHTLDYRMPKPLGWALTLVFVFLTWILFRAETFASATGIWQSVLGLHGWSLAMQELERPWLIGLAGAVALLGPTSQRIALETQQPRRVFSLAIALTLVFAILYIGGGANTEFIYFQF